MAGPEIRIQRSPALNYFPVIAPSGDFKIDLSCGWQKHTFLHKLSKEIKRHINERL